MTTKLKSVANRNIASPYGLVAFSYILFLIGWLFPPSLYTEYIHEPNLMFLDPLTFAFFTLCAAAFVLGVRSSSFLCPKGTASSVDKGNLKPSVLYYIAPVFAGTAFTSVYLLKLGAHFNFVSLLSSQQGQTIKMVMHSEIAQEGRWAISIIVLNGILCWALYRVKQFRPQGISKLVFYFVFICGATVNGLTCVAAVDRTDLMPLMCGLFVVSLYYAMSAKNVNIVRVGRTVGFASCGSIGAFLAISILRGGRQSLSLASSFLGYTVVSYNRLAALLSGTMHYTYGGHGAYLFTYLTETKTFESIFHLQQNLRWPTARLLWQSEFASTLQAGLNGSYIWSGLFGYLYADLGWWSLLYLAILGIIVGYIWIKFQKRQAFALVLYPWMAFCILFWVGSNIIFNSGFVVLLELSALLSLYDWIFLRPRRSQRLSFTPTIQNVSEFVAHGSRP